MTGKGVLAERAAMLRRAFDRSFAEAPSARSTLVEDLLAIRIGSNAYAVRLAEITGLFADKQVTPVPSPVPELLGIVGFRGAVTPVYDLRALLGHRGSGVPRWIVVAAALPVGLAFDHFEGHLRVPRDAIAATAGEPGARGEVVRGDPTRPIVAIPALLDTLARPAREAAAGNRPAGKE